MCWSGTLRDDLDVATFLDMIRGCWMDEQERSIPAVKSVSASWAVLKNSSRSASCVTDLRFDGASGSTAYYVESAGSSGHTDTKGQDYVARLCHSFGIFNLPVDDRATEPRSFVLGLSRWLRET